MPRSRLRSILGHQPRVSRVWMPPAWDRDAPTPYTYVVATREVDARATRRFYRDAPGELANPRLISPFTLSLASIYHPTLFRNLARDVDATAARATPARATTVPVATARFWLQSTLFLAGVTLSAAIVQDRFSAGTVRSKLLRLWQAASVAAREGIGELVELGLAARVRAIAGDGSDDRAKLFALKRVYAEAIAALTGAHRGAGGGGHETRVLRRIEASHWARPRFGFVDELAARLGAELVAIIAYGSAVTSRDYADFDLVVVVRDSAAVLRALAGTRPSYGGKELNMGVYDAAELAAYQLASGDNLDAYGLCLAGEVAVPHKPVEDLIHRNFSFGYVRMRQIMGMAAARDAGGLADKANLYGYFVKIPLNVLKGTRGVRGVLSSKEEIGAMMHQRFGYDVAALTARCRDGRHGDALATAAWCTGALLDAMNATERAFVVGEAA